MIEITKIVVLKPGGGPDSNYIIEKNFKPKFIVKNQIELDKVRHESQGYYKQRYSDGTVIVHHREKV